MSGAERSAILHRHVGVSFSHMGVPKRLVVVLFERRSTDATDWTETVLSRRVSAESVLGIYKMILFGIDSHLI